MVATPVVQRSSAVNVEVSEQTNQVLHWGHLTLRSALIVYTGNGASD
tara:strand:- start:185 stop:325 length:141 start_codon:yes stop_codon:yes gene_type:complete